jgi:hypothetical protein
MYFWMYFLLLVEMSHGLCAVMHTKLLIKVCDMALQRPQSPMESS